MSERNDDVMSIADREVITTRLLDAPRELVWRAWRSKTCGGVVGLMALRIRFTSIADEAALRGPLHGVVYAPPCGSALIATFLRLIGYECNLT